MMITLKEESLVRPGFAWLLLVPWFCWITWLRNYVLKFHAGYPSSNTRVFGMGWNMLKPSTTPENPTGHGMACTAWIRHRCLLPTRAGREWPSSLWICGSKSGRWEAFWLNPHSMKRIPKSTTPCQVTLEYLFGFSQVHSITPWATCYLLRFTVECNCMLAETLCIGWTYATLTQTDR